MALVHENANFQEVLEICCGGATNEQLGLINSWIFEYENKHLEKAKERAQRDAVKKLSDNGLKNIKRLFDIYDTNKDGNINFEELEECFKHVIESEYIPSMTKDLDPHKAYELHEFVRLMAPIFTEITI